MDEHLNEEELLQRLALARTEVNIGAFYKHYKGNTYKVLDVAILESNNEICVIYQAQYGKQLTFIRPVTAWNEEVELDGVLVPRFSIATSVN